jgi:hypothetical protein
MNKDYKRSPLENRGLYLRLLRAFVRCRSKTHSKTLRAIYSLTVLIFESVPTLMWFITTGCSQNHPTDNHASQK